MIFGFLEQLFFRCSWLPGRIGLLSKCLDLFNVGGLRIGYWSQGFKMECNLDLNFERAIYLGLYDLNELEVIRRNLTGKGLFLDCGANLGIYSIFAANQLRKNASVIGVEPNPVIFNRFKRNINLNKFESFVEVHQVAISSSSGNAVLEIPNHTHTMSSLHRDAAAKAGADTESIEVELLTIDQIAAGRSVEGIKLDTEGHELPALEGAIDCLQKHKPWLLLEYNPKLASNECLGSWEVHRLLADLGYQPKLSQNPIGPVLKDYWSSEGTTNLLYKLSV